MLTLAHTATIKQHCTLPYRLVLVEKADEFVVWTECFKENDPNQHDSYMWGHYFRFNGNRKEAFQKAYAKYCQKAQEIETLISDGMFN